MSTSTKAPKTSLTPYLWNAQSLQTATASLNSRWFKKENLIATTISTDTRSIEQGDIFLALSGDNFDGHDYAQMAVDRGAVALIVEKPLDIDCPQLIVNDSRLALGQLGAYRRQQHPNLKVIAITGSSGKTTVKEMLGSVFANLPTNPHTLVTRGNLNNDLGVPMMLLELSDEHQFAILELGANHVGEIAYTTGLVEPDVACILNIGTAHLGEFGGRDKIAEAKAEIYQGLQQTTPPLVKADLGGVNKVAIYPANDDYAQLLQTTAKKYTSTVIGFGSEEIHASEIQITAFESEFVIHVSLPNGEKNPPHYEQSSRLADGRSSALLNPSSPAFTKGGLQSNEKSAYPVKLPLAGEHNVSNALAVTACALSLGVAMEDIVKGLESVQPPKGRLYSQMVGKHRLVDDTYNANPHSVRASANVVASQDGLKVMVLGDIGELGDSAKSEHYKLGADIANMGIDRVYAVGEFAQDLLSGIQSVQAKTQATAYTDKDSLLIELHAFIKQHQHQQVTILFKGSRFMKMETLFEALLSGD